MSDEPETPFSKAVMESMSTDAPEPKTQDTAPAPEPQAKEPAKEPTKAQAKAPESEPEEDLKGFSDEQKTNWKALRESKKEIETRLKDSEATRTDLVSQLDQLKAELEGAKKQFDLDDYERIKSEREELANQVAELDILRSPEVKRARDRVESEIKESAKSIQRLAPSLEGIERVLRMTPEARDKALADMLEDIGPGVSSRIWTLVDRVDTANMAVEEITTSAQSKVEEWRQSKESQVQQQREAETKATEQLYHLGLQTAQEEMPELFSLKDGEDTHNKQVSERLSYTKKVLFEPMTEEETVQTAFLAGIGKTSLVREKAYVEALARSEAERQAMAEKLEAYENAQPSGTSGYTEASESDGGVGYFTRTVLANTGS
jgi:hypothetical protein